MQKLVIAFVGAIVLLVTCILLVMIWQRHPSEPPLKQKRGEELLDKIVEDEPPRLMRIAEESKIEAAQAQCNAFGQMLDAYKLDLGNYPPTYQGLAVLHVRPSDLPDKSKWQGPYAKQDIPPDPWGKPYFYEMITPTQYRVCSFGPDGVFNTADDIVKGTGTEEKRD